MQATVMMEAGNRALYITSTGNVGMVTDKTHISKRRHMSYIRER